MKGKMKGESEGGKGRAEAACGRDDFLWRRRLFSELPEALTDKHRPFLLGLVRAEPDWSLMSCRHLSDMPAIRWKLENLSRLKQSNPQKFAQQAAELEAGLAD